MGVNKNEEYSCILFINNTVDRFIVIPNKYTDTLPDNRWELPNFEHYVPEFDPVDTTIWLTQTYLHVRIKESDLRLRFTTKDYTGLKIHLFENNSLSQEIIDLFENEKPEGTYRTMSYHQAGLVHSGLDHFQKGILAQANLIEIYDSAVKPAYSRVSLKDKVRNFSPKPL